MRQLETCIRSIMILFLLSLAAGCAHQPPPNLNAASEPLAQTQMLRTMKQILILEIAEKWDPIKIDQLEVENLKPLQAGQFAADYRLSFIRKLDSGRKVNFQQSGKVFFAQDQDHIELQQKQPSSTSVVMLPERS